jgi:hypothetical protein
MPKDTHGANKTGPGYTPGLVQERLVFRLDGLQSVRCEK